MDAEYPRVGLDLEQTGSGQETLSQYPNEPKSSWKLTQIGGERPDDDSKQLDNDVVNLQPLQTPAPGVFVHVESLESGDVTLQAKHSLHVNSDISAAKPESLAVVQDPAHASQTDGYVRSRRDSFLDGIHLSCLSGEVD